jgi:hypothetical protein
MGTETFPFTIHRSFGSEVADEGEPTVISAPVASVLWFQPLSTVILSQGRRPVI